MKILNSAEQTLNNLFENGHDGKPGSFYKNEFDKLVYSPIEKILALLMSWNPAYRFDSLETVFFIKNYEPYKCSVESVTYAFEISNDNWSEIYKCEAESCKELLYDLLKGIKGVFEVDYNGHFGNFVYVSVKDKEETFFKDVQKTIHGVILQSIEFNKKVEAI